MNSIHRWMEEKNDQTPAASAHQEQVQLCALQLDLRRDDESPLEATQRWIQAMEKIHADCRGEIDLFVLPELAPLGYSEHTFANFLPSSRQNMDMLCQMDALLADAARRMKTYICYGTVGRGTAETTTTSTSIDVKSSDLTIRQVVLNDSGKVVATYDKSYLCDYGDCAETRFFTPGNRQPVSFGLKEFCFGLYICADMRYPQLSRRLAREHRVDVLLQPAAFARDISFYTWRSFRETRAVENSCYFCGVNNAGPNFGETAIVPPWVDQHNLPAVLGTQEGHLVGTISRARLNRARTTMPFYKELFADADADEDEQ